MDLCKQEAIDIIDSSGYKFTPTEKQNIEALCIACQSIKSSQSNKTLFDSTPFLRY